jgi:hypothetical protein
MSLSVRILSAWWNRAAASSTNATVVTISVIAALRVLALSVGLDRLTTVQVWLTPIDAVVIGLSILTTAGYAARAWFAPATPSSERVARLKRDRVGVWRLMGAAAIIVQAAFIGWMSEELLGIVAQYVQGPLESRRGVVVSLRPTSTPATACKWRLIVRSGLEGATLPICLATDSRASLSKKSLRVGETVEVYIRRTPLGLVVVSIDPVKG